MVAAKPKKVRGPIKRKDARVLLGELLGVDPCDDARIEVWALMRHSILKNIAEGKPLARGGKLNPASQQVPTPLVNGQLPPIRLPLPRKHARPGEVEMDRVNLILLRAFPQLARSPAYFGMLEALFGLDHFEAVRLPTPGQEMPGQRSAVSSRSRQRIKRALRFKEP